MSTSRHEGDHGAPTRREGERLAHESTFVDHRPRERRRTAVFSTLHMGGFALGAGIGLIGTYVATLIADQHYSFLTYLIVAVVMGGVGMALTPFVSLARADGHDADVVRARRMTGSADAPLDGAEAIDHDSSPMGARHARS
jgi:MFS family permease